ncbi:MAG: orotidine-5'-phosphate decarboxylase [Pseudomonadota bacterium]
MPFLANPIFCALDTTDAEHAAALARALAGHVGGVKIGMEFFYAHGRPGYEAVAAAGLPIFLDLKLHDIPNTVAGGLRALMTLDPAPALINVHAGGGSDMMRAAADAVAGRSKLIAVTVLTSLNDADLDEIGFTSGHGTQAHATALAKLAQAAGLDGVVCSSLDIEAIKTATAPDFLTVVPGIRPAGADVADQKRIATPGSAIASGADVLVIGRPITQASAPAEAAASIFQEVEAARG